MKKKQTNLPKKNAGRNLAARLKRLGHQQPPEDLVNKINNSASKRESGNTDNTA